MSTLTPHRHLSLVNLEAIAANQYRSKHADRDYQPEEVDALIWERQAKQAEKATHAAVLAVELSDDELPPPLPVEAIHSHAAHSAFGDIFTPTPAQRHRLGLNEDDELEEAPSFPPPMPREAARISHTYARRPFRRTNQPRIINARFPSRCAETGEFIDEGDSILWYPETKRVYSESSSEYQRFMYNQETQNL